MNPKETFRRTQSDIRKNTFESNVGVKLTVQKSGQEMDLAKRQKYVDR
jgi:hypothetical protein